MLGSIARDSWLAARRELIDLGDHQHHLPFPPTSWSSSARTRSRWPTRAGRLPISLIDVRRRYLPEHEHRGNTAHQKSKAALHLAVTEYAGLEPDYDDVAGWWRNQDLALYSFEALVIMLRIAAERSGRPVAELCGELATAHGVTI